MTARFRDLTDQHPRRDFVGYGPTPPRVVWPGGIRLAVNLVLVYEEGAEYTWLDDGRSDSWGHGAGAAPQDARDLGTESSFEYGSRAGVWRLTRLIDRADIPVTVSGSALAFERNPHVAAWMKERGHDLLGHGLRWTDIYNLDRDEEERQMREAIVLFAECAGLRPLGWNCRSFPSTNTRDLVAREGGFLYYSDPTNDDLPYFVEEAGRPLLVVPYSKALNDGKFLMSPGYVKAGDFADDCRTAIDYMLDEAEQTGGRMITICIHPRWSGQPNRAAAVRDIIDHVKGSPGAAFMRREAIARHWIATYGMPNA